MKQFLSFVRKEFYHIFRDKYTVLILILMPIIQMILFGFALTNEVKNTRFAVLDQSKSIASKRIIEKMDKNDYFTLERYLDNPEQIEKTLMKGEAGLILVFPSDFESEMLRPGGVSVQLIADATEPNQAVSYVNYASSIIADALKEITKYSETPATITPEIKMLYNPQMLGTYNFVPGVMGLILMIICTMMTAIAIVREKERGTMEVLLASPIKPFNIILAKVTPYLALGFIDLSIILILSVFVLGVPIAGNMFLLLLVSFIFILCALSLGLLISNMVNTQVAAMVISGIGLMMPTIILSGMIFPIESMPLILQYISTILPVRWFIQAVRKIMIQGSEFRYVMEECLILTGMVVVLLFVSIKLFNKRLKK